MKDAMMRLAAVAMLGAGLAGCTVIKSETIPVEDRVEVRRSASMAEIEELTPETAAMLPDVDPGALPVQALEELLEDIEERFDDPIFAHAHWGVIIESLDTGIVWYERNSERVFMPASNEKVPTTAAAIMTLGPDFRFTTILAASDELTSPVFNGDLVVWSNGDPTMYNRFFSDPRDVFRAWARTLKERGVERVAGRIIGDDNAFDDDHFGAGWTIDGFGNWWSAEVGPLVVNENYVDVKIVPPATADGQVQLIPNLPSAYYNLVSNVTVSPEGRTSISFERPFGTNEIIFNGTVAAGSSTIERSPAINNPTLWYATVLRETLIEEGIAIDGPATDIDDVTDAAYDATKLPRLIEHESPPLGEILKGLMKRSQNLYAEIMPRAMAWKETGKGTFRGGREILERELEKFGIEKGTYRYADGSGLSRYNYISPEIISTIYKKMLTTPHKQLWWEAQAIMGVDGTLRARGKATPAEGNMRGKTGTIGNVRALSGYVTTADGEDLVFSFIVNGHLVSSNATEDVTDDVVKWLAGFDRFPEDEVDHFPLNPLPRE